MRYAGSRREDKGELFQIESPRERKEQSEIVIKSIFAPFLLPFKAVFLILKLLFFMSGWGAVVTGYCAAIGSGILGTWGLWIGITGRSNGLGASLLAYGGGFFVFGVMLLFLIGTEAMAGGFIRMAAAWSSRYTEKPKSSRKTLNEAVRRAKRVCLQLTAILLIAGMGAGGLGILAGGLDGLDHIDRPDLPFLHGMKFESPIIGEKDYDRSQNGAADLHCDVLRRTF